MGLSLEEARKEVSAHLGEPQVEWYLADKVIDSVYPGWNHIPNNGILRGAIAAMLVAIVQVAVAEVVSGELDPLRLPKS